MSQYSSQPINLSNIDQDMETLSYVNSMIQAFRAFDSNNDGLITVEELNGIMASLGYKITPQEARDMMRRGDRDGDGMLSVEEFMEMNTTELDLGGLGGLLQAAVAAVSPQAGDFGEVTAEDLCNVMRQLMGSASMEECMEIIACMDVDGDGAVSIEDIKVIVEALI